MGFISTANTVTITAKLTNTGRERLLKENNSILSHFMLGDSDANYQTNTRLSSGKIPADSGDLGTGGDEAIIKSKLYLNATNTTKKVVESRSNIISTSITNVGENVAFGSNLTYAIINKNNHSSEMTNLFKSLNLPILKNKKDLFTTTTSANGGWSDTAFSGIGADRVLIAVIDNSQYGELIDGKSIKSRLPIATGYTWDGNVSGIDDYEFYTTFVNSGQYNKVTLDGTYKDKTIFTQGLFGEKVNVSYLVSNNIQRPNNDPTKSWATGYDTFKPFSLNDKELVNSKSVPTTGIFADRVVGVAYLDKGILAYTDSDIVDNIVTNFSGATTATGIVTNSLGLYYYSALTYNTIIDSINTDLTQNIVCKADRGEFYRSNNDTIDINDTVRISEIAITDQAGTILAYAKPDRQIEKLKNDLIIFDIQIII
jgi:hypothetical protein